MTTTSEDARAEAKAKALAENPEIGPVLETDERGQTPLSVYWTRILPGWQLGIDNDFEYVRLASVDRKIELETKHNVTKVGLTVTHDRNDAKVKIVVNWCCVIDLASELMDRLKEGKDGFELHRSTKGSKYEGDYFESHGGRFGRDNHVVVEIHIEDGSFERMQQLIAFLCKYSKTELKELAMLEECYKRALPFVLQSIERRKKEREAQEQKQEEFLAANAGYLDEMWEQYVQSRSSDRSREYLEKVHKMPWLQRLNQRSVDAFLRTNPRTTVCRVGE